MPDERDILEIDGEPFKDKPHGWIQWKGTNVCMDLHCACGAHLHVDEDFFYHWVCGECGRHFTCGSHIAMYELTEDEADYIKKQGSRFLKVEDDEQSFAEQCFATPKP